MLTIGDLSRRSGVSQSALRFYERKGLIESERTDGQPAPLRAGDAAAGRVHPGGQCRRHPARARSAQRSTRCRASKSPTKRDWERLSRGWARQLDDRIATLEALRTRLATCIGCGCLSLKTCRLLNPDDEAGSLGGGAHYLRSVSPRG